MSPKLQLRISAVCGCLQLQELLKGGQQRLGELCTDLLVVDEDATLLEAIGKLRSSGQSSAVVIRPSLEGSPVVRGVIHISQLLSYLLSGEETRMRSLSDKELVASDLIQCSPAVSPGIRGATANITVSTQLRHPFLRMRSNLGETGPVAAQPALQLVKTPQQLPVTRAKSGNKVDLCATAYGRCKTLHDLTEMLQRQCRLKVEPKLLTQEMQLGMRRKLGIGLPLQCKDAFGATVHVILCSEEVHLYQKGDLLVLSDAPAAPAPTPELADAREGWFCFTSRKTGLLYYWNAVTNISTSDAPWGGEPGGLLPDGWTCEVDGSTGRLHFHHPIHGTTMRLP
eukprot:symbB.v1.2.002005.t1/scaffold87.1/size343203/1